MGDCIVKNYGRTVFFLSRNDLPVIEQAMSSLKEIDQRIFSSISEAGISYTARFGQLKFYDYAQNKRFHLKNWMLDGGAYSVVFGIVLNYFQVIELCKASYWSRKLSDPSRWSLLAYERLIEWMSEKGFSESDIEYAENCWYWHMGIERDKG